MGRCGYCSERAGFWSRVCRDCRKLLDRTRELRALSNVGYRELLDGLEATGAPGGKIMAFLKADPFGEGSIQDQITADMASELMRVMGLGGSQSADDVKQIRKSVEKEKS
jgi:hypothetical protein